MKDIISISATVNCSFIYLFIYLFIYASSQPKLFFAKNFASIICALSLLATEDNKKRGQTAVGNWAIKPTIKKKKSRKINIGVVATRCSRLVIRPISNYNCDWQGLSWVHQRVCEIRTLCLIIIKFHCKDNKGQGKNSIPTRPNA